MPANAVIERSGVSVDEQRSEEAAQAKISLAHPLLAFAPRVWRSAAFHQHIVRAPGEAAVHQTS